MVCLVVLSGVKPWKMLLFFIPFLLAFISSASSMMLFGKGRRSGGNGDCSGYRKKASIGGCIWALRDCLCIGGAAARHDNVLGGFVLQPDAEAEACTEVCLQLHGFDPAAADGLGGICDPPPGLEGTGSPPDSGSSRHGEPCRHVCGAAAGAKHPPGPPGGCGDGGEAIRRGPGEGPNVLLSVTIFPLRSSGRRFTGSLRLLRLYGGRIFSLVRHWRRAVRLNDVVWIRACLRYVSRLLFY